MGEYRQDAGSLVSLKRSGATTSISHTSNLSPSYLIPFILGFMNFHACKSDHRHVGNRKVKAPIAICVPAPFNLDDFMLLQVQSTWVHLLRFYIFTFTVIQYSFELLLLHLSICSLSCSSNTCQEKSLSGAWSCFSQYKMYVFTYITINIL